jgi:hypothetical protein
VRTRTLTVPLIALCLWGGLLTACGGHDDDKAGSSSSSTTGSPTSGASPDTSPSPSPGDSATDGMKDDNHGAPGDPDAKGRQTVFLDRYPEGADGSCQAVGNEHEVRSGGFVGGAFDDARKSYGKARPGMKPKQVRLYWFPEHTKPMKGVTVVATSAGKTVRVTQHDAADLEQWKFYDTNITLPTGGRWQFKVSSGPDHGCFVVSF